MNHVFETRRLILREMSLDDLDFIATILADPQVMRHWPKTYSRDEAEQGIRQNIERYARFGYGLWLALEKSSGRPLGRVGLVDRQIGGRPEIELGYMIHHPYWRMGYASEASAAARDYAVNTLNRPRVVSLVRPINIPSQRVAMKIGMRPEGLTMHCDMEHLVFSTDPVFDGGAGSP
jgi:RimJ/RimL family protein N-acetyltransferase